MFSIRKDYQYEVILFTKRVAIERRRSVVKNTNLKNVLILQFVIEFFGRPEGSVLYNSKSTLLVACPDVPADESFVEQNSEIFVLSIDVL